METVLFTSNATGAMLLDILRHTKFRPHVVTYRAGFQRTGLAADFDRFTGDFPITFISSNSFDESLAGIVAGKLPVCVDWTKDFFQDAPFPVICSHPSLLPKYRGYSAVTEQFGRGVAVSGASFYIRNEQIDGGDIIFQEKIKIAYNDYPMDFLEKYVRVCAGFLSDLESHGYESLPRIPQDSSAAFYLQRKRTRDAIMDFNRDAFSLYNHVRAYSKPYFGAYFMRGDKKVTVWKAITEKWQGDYGEPGTVIDAWDDRIEIACGSGSLILTQYEGLDPDEIAAGENFIS